MPLSVATICATVLRETGFPTQTAYVSTQVGDLVNRCAADIAQKPFKRPIKRTSLTMASQTAIASTSVTRVTTTATFTCASAHGYTTGDLVTVAGVTPAGYNGTFQITVTGSTTFTYVMPADPGGSATVQGNVTHQAHGLPSDFQSYVPDTMLMDNNLNDVIAPETAANWADYKSGTVNPGGVLPVRFYGGYLYIHNPIAGSVLRYEYQSNALFTDSTGFTGKQRFTADTDIWIMHDDLLMMNLRWRWKKEKGIDDWQVDAAEYEKFWRTRLAEESGARTLRIAGDDTPPISPPQWKGWA